MSVFVCQNFGGSLCLFLSILQIYCGVGTEKNGVGYPRFYLPHHAGVRRRRRYVLEQTPPPTIKSTADMPVNQLEMFRKFNKVTK